MKVCFLTNELRPTHGWGSYSISLIKALARKNISFKIFTAKKSQNISELPTRQILESDPNNFYKKFFVVKDYLMVKKELADCDIIHCLSEPYAPLACRLAKKIKKPFFITAHGTFFLSPLENKKVRQDYLKAYRAARKIFCVSAFTQKIIIQKTGLTNTLVINNGVNFNKFQAKETPDLNNEKIILSVGVIKPRKGYHISIPAVKSVISRYPNLKYYIVGDQKTDPDYFLKLQGIVKYENLGKNVFFLGNVSDDDLTKLYYRSSLFLLTPINYVNIKFEGFGLVYLEAGACGKPVIGAKNSGAEDAIIDGVTGYLVPDNDINATSGAILKILDNQALATQMGKAGLAHAKKFDWRQAADLYFSEYEKTA